MVSARIRQFGLYVAVGGGSALLDFGLFELLHFAGIPAAIASGMSFLTSTLLNYWANRKWVFSNKFTWANLSKYFVLVGANLLVSMLIVFLATQNHLDASLAKFASMCLIVLINFFLLRRWVFRDPRM